MRKRIYVVLLLILVLCFSSCSFTPDAVTINGKEYKRAFAGELYPMEGTLVKADGIKVSGNAYYKFFQTPYDCYIAYGNAEPNIYFATEQFEEAKSHYSDSAQFNFFCLLGNIYDANERIGLESVDSSMFDALIAFSKENEYKPFAFVKNEEDLQKVPVSDPDDWMADEIHFYKESKDGAFTTSRGYTFKIYEDELFLLYQYDFSDAEAPTMLLRAIPSEISDYFCSLLYQQKIITDKTANCNLFLAFA